MLKIFVFCLVVLTYFSSNGNVVAPRTCGGRVFVDKPIVIDAPIHDDCIWEFQTKDDRILLFTLVDGNLKEAQEFFKIHDGLDSESPILLVENQKILERSRKDLPVSVYTTQSTASVRFTKAPTSNLKLKIEKAVNCPANVGAQTECGRLVDSSSCYCADYNKRSQADQTAVCNNNGYYLLALESRTEEDLIAAAWSTGFQFWTSLSYSNGYWIWESTNVPINGGYFNWAIGQPDGSGNCVHLNAITSKGGWNDDSCATPHEAVCEGQP
ncbi:hypothetical protein DAPPUDRAFT_305445 [Daphnia pulex]|uniref:C-type lectin domain-containing protein n=1 Tax=Daphnia pulex TaxID=6669 RepID=E9FWJ5_DAPPU|nr:hypothetical protein DAPPUDRAFT_305445 [Daphnia pulex]|eukprot:EFX88421.1 hypothetical protein DAPPUDRAFT_305445 [Daphnia pulex]